jgi:hypothetical protein
VRLGSRRSDDRTLAAHIQHTIADILHQSMIPKAADLPSDHATECVVRAKSRSKAISP